MAVHAMHTNVSTIHYLYLIQSICSCSNRKLSKTFFGQTDGLLDVVSGFWAVLQQYQNGMR